ncbi:ArsR/SmtB family transcription factor [Sulfitobacter donghicola]|uniref:ArsR family transcriptional regulator n=1 Tax=Sulfitobacter donghicola DSW-25 = KCTC 12864 = JCM 14565 TaxID=1300350 RepID=A0A073IJM6_9RHOB|nr:metalloregulator ArsR/SmtB family transcription factor [Sulfitobacter donghicola]KEJ89964.1 ArsR family transcriptional regulator [Sulfitobacter donghicola DSW-25 = KCTC 12864 = JCM 14565]KIN66907.1 Transcriptional regulator, ArsR family protein [Sulfitobacter donghicola DSW-25 = KCTC 12864 = JCM 14565]
MDMIFKALADPARRTLLDALRTRDGQNLAELTELLDMSRFGVMKHLGVLEDAGLIVTRKDGRFKYHYLNAVPLQQAIDRWIEPLLVKPAARAVLTLKSQLEGTTPMQDTMTKPDFMTQTFIRCTQDALWDALTKPDQMAAYHFACNAAKGGTAEGESVQFIRQDGSTMLTQKVTASTPKTKLEMTFEPHFSEAPSPASRMIYLIEPQGETCKLTIEHYDIPEGQEAVREGWARIAASLKSWLETGTPIKLAM